MPSIDDNATGVKDAGKQQVWSHEGDLDGRLLFILKEVFYSFEQVVHISF